MANTALHVALLRETRTISRCRIEDVLAKSNIDKCFAEPALLELESSGILRTSDDEIQVSPGQRVKLAERAIADGCDPETVARQLKWQEFEALAEEVLIERGYVTARHFVFKASEKRFEIDVLGAKEPMVLCIDCKHWHHGWSPSRISTAATNQLKRTAQLSRVLEKFAAKIPTADWRSVFLLPVVMTLADVSRRDLVGVPVVSALRFMSFLSEVSPWIDGLPLVEAPKGAPRAKPVDLSQMLEMKRTPA